MIPANLISALFNLDQLIQIPVLAVSSAGITSNTVLSLQSSSTNTATGNNVFIDSSANSATITRFGDVGQGSAGPHTNARWAAQFNGTSYITMPASVGALGSGAFTLELWIFSKATPIGALSALLTNSYWQTGTNGGWRLEYLTTGKINLNASKGAYNVYPFPTVIQTATSLPLNRWVHLAITKDNSGTVRCFFDGVLDVNTGTSLESLNQGSVAQYTAIGASLADGTWYSPPTCLMSNVRIVNGTAVYTAAFSPITSPLVSVPGTALLTLQDGRIIDRSGNAVVLTASGVHKCITDSPFGPSAEYDPVVHGGSLYFDGAGDYLQTAASSALEFGAGDLTVEFWFYPKASTYQWMLHAETDFWFGICYNCADIGGGQKISIFASSTGTSWDLLSAGNASSTGVVPVDQWTHVAVTRSGTTWKIFLNGVASFTTTKAGSIVDRSAQGKKIGVHANNSVGVNGYLADFHVVKGTARYSADFIPPTAPVMPITGTALLLRGTNSIAYDAAGKNVLLHRGTGPLSPAPSRFSANYPALNFNGVKVSPARPAVNLQDQFFTVQAWVYFTSLANYQVIASNYQDSSTGFILARYQNKICAWFSGDAVDLTGSTTPVVGQWYHVALSGKTGNIKLFVNGVAEGTHYGPTALNSSQPVAVGYLPISGGINVLTGMIEDLEIVVGASQYSATFVPPARTARESVAVVGGNYLEAPNYSTFEFGYEDFTIEGWFYRLTNTGLNTFFSIGSYNNGLMLRNAHFSMAGIGGTDLSAYLPMNVWYHVAVTRSAGSAVRVFVNGKTVFSGTSSSYHTAAMAFIGSAVHSPTETFEGYVEDFRILKGVARYKNNFLPGAVALSAPVDAVFTTWNPLDKGVDNELSNGNLTTTHNGTNTNNAVRSTVGKSSGKWYWEVTCDYSPLNYFYFGIGAPTDSKTGPGNSGSLGFSLFGTGVYVNGSKTVTIPQMQSGRYVGFALDLDNGLCEIYVDGVYTAIARSGLAGTFHAMANTAGSSTSVMTANFGATPFKGTVPIGFNPGLYA